jgi:hypothetical protein
MKYTNHRDLFFFLPLGMSGVVGLLLMALGLSGGNNITIGESVFILGLSLFASAIITYVCKKPIDRYLFDPKRTNQIHTQLVFSFILFFLYFTWVSPPIVTFIEEADIWTLLVLLLLNGLFFIAHWLVIRYIQKPYVIWVALIGFVGLSTAFRFIVTDSVLVFQLYLLYISYGLFISFILIGDIFYLINFKN